MESKISKSYVYFNEAGRQLPITEFAHNCSIVSTIGSEKGARIGAVFRLSRWPIGYFDPVRQDLSRDEPYCEHWNTGGGGIL
jgi:hypothetical protein